MKAFPVLLAVALAARAEDVIPAAPDRSRYADTVATSPFVLETKAVEAPAVEVKNPFANLFLRGIGKADGKDYVLIQRLGEEKSIRLTGTEPGEDQLAIKSMKVGSNFRETKVVLSRGVEIGEIGFKEDALTAPPPAPKGPGGTPMAFPKPGGAATTGVPPLPGAASFPGARPTTPSVNAIPRPGGSPVPMPSTPPTIPGSPRTRTRVINSQ